MDEDEDILVVKSPVYLFNIPPRLQRRKGYIHRAADWDVKNPNWHGKISLIAAGPKCCHLQLEDFDGDVYAQAVIESYPTPIIQPVIDSKRFFLLEIQTISGDHELVGIGYNTRNDSGEFIDTLEEYFTKTGTEERVKRAAPPVKVLNPPPPKKAKTDEDSKLVETDQKVDREDPGKSNNETTDLCTNGHTKTEDSSFQEEDQKADMKADADVENGVAKLSVDSEIASAVKPDESEPLVQATSATVNIDNPVVESKTVEAPSEINVPMDTDTTDNVDAPEIVKSTELDKTEIVEAENLDQSERQQPLTSSTEEQSEKVDDIVAATEVAQEAVSEVVAAAESAADDALDMEPTSATVEHPADDNGTHREADNVAESAVVDAMEVGTAASGNVADKEQDSDVAMDQESPILQQLAEAPVQENVTAENNESDLVPESSPSLGATLQAQDSLDLLTAGIDDNEALDLDILETAVLPLEDTTESTHELEAMGNKVLMDATEAAAESSNLEGSVTAENVNPIANQLDEVVENQSETPDNGTDTIEPETIGETNDTTEESEVTEPEDEEKQEKEVDDEEEKVSMNNSMSVDESEDPLAGAEPASEAEPTLPPGYKYQTEPGGAFNCHKCPETFATYNLMKRHWSTIHNFKQASHCPVCLLPFPNKAEVTSHKLDVHVFKCEDCGKQFKKDQGLREHQRQSHGKTNLFQCPHCDTAFKVKFQLVKHIEAEHEDESGEACIHQCGVCNQKFVTEEELNVHKQKHEGSNGCPHCSEWTFSGPRMASKKKLAEHIRKQHPDKVQPLGPRRVSTRGHRE